LQNFINTYKEQVDRKYNRIVSRLNRKLTHPVREQETELGNLIADIFSEIDTIDVVLVGSGSIRGKELGPVVTLEDLKKVYPYDGSLYKIKVTGAQLTKVFTHFLRPENRKPGESQCYQISKGVRVVYNNTKKAIESFSINEQPVEADRLYVICVQDYHYQNSLKSLNLTPEEISSHAKLITQIKN
jgi:5'-nucleotidase